MMSGVLYVVNELLAEDVPAAAALLARQHRRARRLLPLLPSEFEDDGRCAAVVSHLWGGSERIAARHSGRLVGYAIGRSTRHFGVVPAGGLALADGVDRTSVWGSLYAELASRWRRIGVTAHDIELPALRDLEEACANMGFGRRTCFGVRRTEPALGETLPAGTRVFEAGPDHLDDIARLSAEETRYRTLAPNFAEEVDADVATLRAHHQSLMAAGAVHLLAARSRQIVGLLTLELASPAPMISTLGPYYIGPTAIAPSLRGRGVGAILVDAALGRAAKAEREQLSVSFNTANLASRPFWLRMGFLPHGWKLARRLASSA